MDKIEDGYYWSLHDGNPDEVVRVKGGFVYRFDRPEPEDVLYFVRFPGFGPRIEPPKDA